MDQAAQLFGQTQQERTILLTLVTNLTDEQASYKPSPEVWSVNENLEHLVLAEISGISKIWAAAEGVKKGKPVWTGEHTNRGLTIDQIVARTWKPRELAPPIATPHIGGPLSYWVESLRQNQLMLNKLGTVLQGLDLETVLFPHFLCGPLDAAQRLDFLRLHIIRHRNQITALRLE